MKHVFYNHGGRGSISSQLLVGILVASSIVTFFITMLQLGFDYFQDVNGLETNISLIQKSYVKSLEVSLWEMNDSQLKEGLNGLIAIPGIQYVQVVHDGATLAEAGLRPENHFIKKEFDLNYSGSSQPQPLGRLLIYANLEPLTLKLYQRALLIFLSQFVKTLLVSSIIYLIIRRLLTRHLETITRYLRGMDWRLAHDDLVLDRKGSRIEPTPEGPGDEIDQLANAINDMRSKLRGSYAELNAFTHGLEQRVEENTRLIIEQRQQLEHSAKMSALGEMAGGVAHEINNPLTIIRIAAESMAVEMAGKGRDDLDLDHVRTHLRRVQHAVARISKTIRAMVFFSRSGDEDPYEVTPFTSICSETLALCQDKFRDRQVRLHVDIENPNVSFACRPVQISQVLLNLLNNAFDAIEHLPEKWIRLSIRDNQDQITICVIDSGRGVPEAVRAKVMMPFFTTKDAGRGTGLGLSISKRIVDLHGGTLTLDSDHPHTRFVITLPKVVPTSSTRDFQVAVELETSPLW